MTRFVIRWVLMLSLLMLCLPNLSQAEDMPRISITTVEQTGDTMRFATAPVARYVASQIATWTPGYRIPPKPYYEACTVSVYDESGACVLEEAEASVKVRGNWTTSYPKKPLRIKFAQKQEMLGLNGGAEMKNWVLLAEYKDGSMLRNRTALTIADGLLAPLGLYAADTRLVEVEINGQYWGVYLLAEHQQVNENRVNVTEPEEGYEGTDIGYFLSFDGYANHEEPLSWFMADYAGHAPLIPFDGNGGSGLKQRGTTNGITIKSDVYSAEQRSFIASYVKNVYKVLYCAAYRDEAYVFDADYTDISQTTDITPKEAVERVINVDSLAAVYIINELACDADIYMAGVFMSADFGQGGDPRLTFHAPWDFDSALGNKDRCASGEGFYAANVVYDVDGEYTTINPWMAVLIYEDWFQQRIREQWTAAYDAGVFDRAMAQIGTETAQYEAAFARNYDRWDNIVNNGEFAHELTAASAACRTQAECAALLQSWLKARVDFLNEQWYLPGE